MGDKGRERLADERTKWKWTWESRRLWLVDLSLVRCAEADGPRSDRGGGALVAAGKGAKSSSQPKAETMRASRYDDDANRPKLDEMPPSLRLR